jgi:hypothetical protein
LEAKPPNGVLPDSCQHSTSSGINAFEDKPYNAWWFDLAFLQVQRVQTITPSQTISTNQAI